ncbi:MAG: GNAT family N-acetyltransferase [Candidatus Eremiobacteraeota bacterium]|nr:GNAT family N-acetyltransferase [Candidatus Eremiobacteraeota bacterium]
MADVEIAQASEGDIRSIARRRRFDEPGFRLALELAERGTVWAARDAGEVVGSAIAYGSEFERQVGDLFVEPSYRGQGVGGRLLQAAFSEADDVARSMLLPANDPAAQALALRHRLTPSTSVLRFAGAIPREDELAKMAAGDYRFEVQPLDPTAHASVLDELDREARGAPRDAVHSELLRSGFGQVFFRDSEPVAYLYVWPDGRLGPLAASSPAYLVQIFGYALVTLGRQCGASWCSLLVPGSNLRIGRAALRAGLRIQRSFVFATDSPDAAMSNYLGFQKVLF